MSEKNWKLHLNNADMLSTYLENMLKNNCHMLGHFFHGIYMDLIYTKKLVNIHTK